MIENVITSSGFQFLGELLRSKAPMVPTAVGGTVVLSDDLVLVEADMLAVGGPTFFMPIGEVRKAVPGLLEVSGVLEAVVFILCLDLR